MSNDFREVKIPLKRKNLIAISENTFKQIASIHPILQTYEEIKEAFSEKGLSINNIYISNEGLYPFWYNDGFVFIPSPSVHFFLENDLWNKESIISQKRQFQSYWKKGNYSTFFAMFESQFSFDIFFSHLEEIPKEKRYDIFKKLYTRNDYGFQDIDIELITELFALNTNRDFVKNLPVESDGCVTIYRGMQGGSASPDEAYSWTLDFEVAKRFATRFNSTESSIYQAKVKIDDIVDYLSEGNIGDRAEREILILPKNLMEVKNMGFYNMNQELMTELTEEGYIDMYHENAFDTLKGKWFHKPDGIHGKRHIKRVLFLSLIMSYLDDLSYEDRSVLIYASLYHDIGRTNDWEDEGHGMQGVLKMENLKLRTNGLNDEDISILKFIMKYHSIRDEVGLRKLETEHGIHDKERAIDLFKRFKDCDGLDRVRLGDLDVNYIRTETGKKLLLVAYELLQNIE